MINQLEKILIFCLFAVLCFNCNPNTIETYKYSPNDPFQESIVSSQYFEIDPKQDNVIEGKRGTLVVLPQGCFTDFKGKIVLDNVRIELTEALTIDDMLLSNLTTTSDGQLLETDGMIYLNATSNDEQILINEENPIHIEIPTSKRKKGMMAYKGLRNEEGNMNWIEPKKIYNYLIPIDQDQLNFYPKGFEIAVENNMPFKNHKKATKVLIDSLYYSLSIPNGKELLEGETDIQKSKKGLLLYFNSRYFDEDGNSLFPFCGIDPAIIKVIRGEKYSRTLLSTREFEQRLQVIFANCRQDILEAYINNIDKNLWEIDSLILAELESDFLVKEFSRFYEQGLMNVRDADKYSSLLKGYYEKQLKAIKIELELESKKAIKYLQEKNTAAEILSTKYNQLLAKREKYRMETYGFQMTETGWVNIDIGVIEKDWSPKKLEIIAQKGDEYDRVYTYVIYTSIKSLYRLSSSDNTLFYAGNIMDKEMLMPNNKRAVAVLIGYKGDETYLAIKEFKIESSNLLELEMKKSSSERIKMALMVYDSYEEENNINTDLEAMMILSKEKKRREKLKSESELINKLWGITNSCCEVYMKR